MPRLTIQKLTGIIEDKVAQIGLPFAGGVARNNESGFVFPIGTCRSEAQVGQEGVCQRHKVDVARDGADAEALVMTEPQELFRVFEEDFDVPPIQITVDDARCGGGKVAGGESDHLFLPLAAGEHNAYGAVSSQGGVEGHGAEPLVRAGMVFAELDGASGAGDYPASVYSDFVLLPVYPDIPIGGERGIPVEPVLLAGVEHFIAGVKGVEQDDHPHAGRNARELVHTRDRMVGEFAVGSVFPAAPVGAVVCLDAERNRHAARVQHCCHERVAGEIPSSGRVFDLVQGLHAFPPFAYFRIVYYEIQYLILSQIKRLQLSTRRCVQKRFRLPVVAQKPAQICVVRLLWQYLLEGINVLATPSDRYGQHEHPEMPVLGLRNFFFHPREKRGNFSRDSEDFSDRTSSFPVCSFIKINFQKGMSFFA